MALYKKSRIRDGDLRRFLPVLVITLLGVYFLLFLPRTNSATNLGNSNSKEIDEGRKVRLRGRINLPKQSELSILLENRNQLPPRNMDLYPTLAKDHIIIVLYVHNRPQYLQLVVDSLSNVVGISETLLIVSHDGYFEEMNKIVEGIKFCQVKQIFASYSPHVFPDSFPGVSPKDCKDKDDPIKNHCVGNSDQYGNHRAPKIVSLKHHWWWMMNTVWDGLKETRQHSDHILFIEEDHFIFPNAYRNLQLLMELKPQKCPDCYAANLAPSDVKSRGEGWESLIAERMGNVGYAFNRTIWWKIHRKTREYCFFDEYNWAKSYYRRRGSWVEPKLTLAFPRVIVQIISSVARTMLKNSGENILSFTRTEVLIKRVWNLDLMILIQRQLDEGKLPQMNSCLSASVKGNVIVGEDNVYFSASCMKPTGLFKT